jgi:hypothetical protein|tara:strand:- start:1614 stop:2021 length:408 start_codon:yes stop_codon:yes gene_type:complete
MRKSATRKRAMAAGYRSGLEETTADNLKERGISFTYEEDKIKWLDSKERTYTPDFVLENGIIIETKGRFVSADRRKHKEIKKQYPDKDIRFVFSNSRAKLYKGAKSSYGDWCDKEDFLYSDKVIPEEWTNEEKSK